MQAKLLQWLLGNHATSSWAGYLVLAFTGYQQLTAQGFDAKWAGVGAGLFFVLRFMNEGQPNFGKLLNSVLALRGQVEGMQDRLPTPGVLVSGGLISPVAQSPNGWFGTREDDGIGELNELARQQADVQRRLAENDAALAANRAKEEAFNAKLAADTARLSNPHVRANL